MSSISRRCFLAGSLGGAALLPGELFADADRAGATKWPENFFLSENFAPVHEEVTADDLPVRGKIPPELNGMYLRNGPNPQFPPLGNYHWFDGDGMIHGVRFADGRASYMNRYVRTAGWKKEHEAGQALWTGFADPVELKDVTARLIRGESPFKNTANTALVWHHGKLLALWELGFPHELLLPGLETKGLYSFGGALRHAMTAHPKIDARTGEMMVIGYSPLPPFLQYSVIDRTGRVTHTTPVPVRRPVFMHDFAITEQYTVLLELPAVFDPYSSGRGGEFVRFDADHGARIGLLPRHGTGDEIRWFEIEACFVYHVLNAFEQDGKVHLFACRMPNYPKAFGMSATVSVEDFGEIFDRSRPVMYRWTCDLETGNVQEEPLDDAMAEYPRFDDRVTGRTTRYGYVISADPYSSSLLQYELPIGRVRRHFFGRGRMAGETVFAPRPEGTTEEDGWLITYVYDRADEASECVVIDARDITASPVARIRLPQRVPYGFHALWVDGAVL
ncbi:Carotenoid cleavage oxygenase [Maioricimonas rarisocia]|uniref:Carotenoid cleavage oxygenase n=1 Tax=Maioricimonas rarisocia TaxID=2528026 RepID=A0A517ZAK0_9PLAN|nr:carotenoid oxygenase family protein [Maioricimonas rarisocia]QDU39487.1 Carotenoid cleavage oxygenase [Maioricimonas rarisocia]